MVPIDNDAVENMNGSYNCTSSDPERREALQQFLQNLGPGTEHLLGRRGGYVRAYTVFVLSNETSRVNARYGTQNEVPVTMAKGC